ncbi:MULTISPECIES: DUF4350 domain-containing protein [unclassified Streptomyces]|uniref:DUF4350 domain-containing protein n=1 Tax=unclassified Streptomyces TaxID=2593676 RepID=UPI0006FA40BB|nr:MULTISPECIES: DUF4350 domain-containing protein [unclassified Streptomyces]KQX52637.1 hypothetical protein ASD33_04980 [Streptomyces sp. Root1304]KRA89551.1 hypothetical protein ASE09_04985 [Streptomyces sp. Root66D1]
MSRPAAATSTAASPRQLWTRARGAVLVVVLVLVGGLALATVRSTGSHGALDPRSADPHGSRAVAELLKAQGVTITVATTLDEATAATGTGSTLLVTTPDLLTETQQSTLRRVITNSAGRTVLIGAGAPSLPTLAPDVSSATSTPVDDLAPSCTLTAATRAGSVDLGGERYHVDSGATADSCYPSDGLPTLVRLPGTGTTDTVLLGSPDILHNARLDQQGNASLALQLLGSRPHLVWYLPSLSDATADASDADSTGDFLSLIPSGWLWATLQLALAAVLAAFWRGRRLGPLVTERLPVALRASEATEGRARLYRKTNARDRAATVLRTATRTRIAPLLGVPAQDAHSSERLLPALSARLPETTANPRDLLFGPAPADDAALIRLADQLDALEREVRTS